MTDQSEVRQVEFADQCCHIIGKSIVVVAAGRLIRTAVATPVEADAPETVLREGGHLIVPHLTTETETVEEQNRRAVSPFPPVEVCPVFCCDEGHL